ncbi:MAG: hypothetical protein HY351_05280 [Candidatus Omnitrophica bacterium]|nr:hypothetical protein [Candidatus Omnitrophota bacterium]
MRIVLPILTFFLIVFIFSPMAHADRFYFYKQADKTLKKDARFDTHWFEDVREKFPGVEMRYNLPRRRQNNTDEVASGISLVAQSNDMYYFSIEKTVIRGNEKVYPLYMYLNNITQVHPLYEQITAYESVDGRIRTKNEISVVGGDRMQNSLYPEFYFRVAPLPQNLYLDYKFKIRKEGGSEEVFEGTIPMELTSYSIGLWEKIWS